MDRTSDTDRTVESSEAGGETAEARQTLWLLAISPTVWAGHFLASYVTVAVWCAKRGQQAELGWTRTAIGVYTLAALAAIGAVGWIGWRRHTYGTAARPHDFDTRADRHRFLGFSTVLLSGMSAVATVYVALAAVFVETCR